MQSWGKEKKQTWEESFVLLFCVSEQNLYIYFLRAAILSKFWCSPMLRLTAWAVNSIGRDQGIPNPKLGSWGPSDELRMITCRLILQRYTGFTRWYLVNFLTNPSFWRGGFHVESVFSDKCYGRYRYHLGHEGNEISTFWVVDKKKKVWEPLV